VIYNHAFLFKSTKLVKRKVEGYDAYIRPLTPDIGLKGSKWPEATKRQWGDGVMRRSGKIAGRKQ